MESWNVGKSRGRRRNGGRGLPLAAVGLQTFLRRRRGRRPRRLRRRLKQAQGRRRRRGARRRGQVGARVRGVPRHRDSCGGRRRRHPLPRAPVKHCLERTSGGSPMSCMIDWHSLPTLTSSQAKTISSGGSPSRRMCLRHELKLAASGCT